MARPATAANSWTVKATMPTARYALAASVVNNALGQPILYVMGGLDGANTPLRRVEGYNVATNTWSRKADLPYPRENTNGAVVIGGKIYLSGGRNAVGTTVNSLYLYNPSTNTWTTRAGMPVENARGVSGVINGKLYVLVGFCANCSNHFPSRLYRYDPSTNTWARRADCPRQHVGGADGVIGGTFYVVDGCDGGCSDVHDINGFLDVYDPVTNTWKARAPGAGGAGAATVLANKLYAVGGFFAEDVLASTVAYNPATNTWAEKAPMGAARDALAAATATYSGVSYIFAVGGILSTGWVTGRLERYTP